MEVLEARDKRVSLIEELLKTELVVVSLRANYPGEKKNNLIVTFITDELDTYLKDKIEIKKRYQLNEGEGPCYLYVLNSHDPLLIKQIMIDIEKNHPLGRLVDLDVYYKNQISISRSLLNEPRRRCFLCENEAFYCIRNQSHSLVELMKYINEVVQNYEGST